MIVVWRVNTHCNLACGFCAYARDLEFRRAGIDAARVRAFGQTLAAWRREHGERVLVSWLGGEPMQWRAWRAMSAEFAAAGLDVSATTNGLALANAETRAAIALNLRELTISVDARGERHDSLRARPGLFARLGEGVRALAALPASRGLRLRVNAVLMRDTIAEFGALAREVAAWGIHEITFNQLGGNDRPEFFARQRLLPAQFDTFCAQLPALRAELAERGVRLAGSAGYLARLAASAGDQTLPVKDCAPGERFLFVDEHGVVAPCSFTGTEYGVPVDSIASVAALDALPAQFRAARLARESRWCGNCPSTQVFGKFAA